MEHADNKRTRPGEGGYALVVVMVLVSAMFVMGTGYFTLVGSEVKSSQQSLDSQKAFWLAEAGKERALRYLQEMSHPPMADFTVYDEEAGPDGGHYTVQCLVDSNSFWMTEKAFVLDSVGNSRGVERRVRQWVKMTSFAQYAMFTDEESNGYFPLWYISGDQVEGRLHTNGTYHVYGTPTFQNDISSSSDHMVAYPSRNVSDISDFPIGATNPSFGGNVDLGVPEIPMPTDLPDLRDTSLFGGVYSGTATEVELGVSGAGAGVVAPGWLRWREYGDPSAVWTSVEIGNLAAPVLYSEGDVYIKGTLDGELTVASHRNVRIEDNLLYEGSNAAGEPQPGCDDLLGLVAERNVIISDNAANASDLIVNGVLMALDTSITVENYDSGPPRGTLTIYGGLIQKYRGAVGQFRYGTIIHGYQKDYHYDARVTGRTPPSYPMTGVYEKVAWEETWDDSDPF